MRWTHEDLASYQARTNAAKPYVAPSNPVNPRAKFKNIRTEAIGKSFSSKLEASRWLELEQMQALGAIKSLRAQVPFPLMADGGDMVGTYVADYVYEDAKTGQRVVEDAKGFETPLFRWKARHFKAQYGFEITKITRVRK